MINALLQVTFFLLSFPIRWFENGLWKSAESVQDEKLAPVFIVGAPRTGSTILYQSLTSAYRIQFIDNLTCRWHRNLRFGLWLSRLLYGEQPHNVFQAVHGDSSGFGGHAPCECGEFWYRWLPRSLHFIDHHEVTDEMVIEIRREVFGASRSVRQPLLFKNLNAGQRLRLIARAFPAARIIYLQRDPAFVVRSILKARKKVGIKPGEWWSIMPPNVKSLQGLPEPQMCAAQVFYIEKQIEEDLTLFRVENVRKLRYNHLSEKSIAALADWLDLDPRQDSKLPDFYHDEFSVLDIDEQLFLRRALDSFTFTKGPTA